MESSHTLREKVADALREEIVRGELPSGTRLQEIEISIKYKTSRTPVREAFRLLESEGFLLIKPRRGAIVAPISEKDIREFYEMKAILEGYAARCATPRLTDSEIERMSELNSELKECYKRSDVSGMVPAHNEFHQIFVKASGNEQLSSLIEGLVRRFQRYRIALSHTSAIAQSIESHEKILEAFRARDAELAAYLVSQNSEQGSAALMSTLKFAA